MKASPWQTLAIPLTQEDVASFLVKEMLKKLKEQVKNEALLRVEYLKTSLLISPAPRLQLNWTLIILAFMVMLGNSRALASPS